MSFVPFAVSFAVALVVVPRALGALRANGFIRKNYREVEVPFPAGVVLVLASLVALAPLAIVGELTGWDFFEVTSIAGERLFPLALVFVVGVAFLGLVDDLIGRSGAPGAPRGWREHFLALRRGELSTGMLKAIGTLALAAIVLAGTGESADKYLVSVALFALSANLFNLLDTKPGRTTKAFLLLTVALSLGSWYIEPLEVLGLFCGPLLVVGFYDLRERAMLGDTGSNLIGAMAGIWLVMTLSDSIVAESIALAVVAALNLFGEFRSLGATIERLPLIRSLDSSFRK